MYAARRAREGTAVPVTPLRWSRALCAAMNGVCAARYTRESPLAGQPVDRLSERLCLEVPGTRKGLKMWMRVVLVIVVTVIFVTNWMDRSRGPHRASRNPALPGINGGSASRGVAG